MGVVTLVTSGCVPRALHPGELQPGTATIPVDQRVAVWQHAITVLLDEGYVPQVLNEAACYVSAHQRDDVTIGALVGTTAIVSIPPDGNVRVQVSGVGIYSSQDQLVSDLAHIQARLLSEIVGRPAPKP